MKIAIHKRIGSFSDGWIKYCIANEIPYKIVNCYDNDIIYKVRDCDGLMWHWDQNDYKASLFAKQLTISIENMGLQVFPNLNTVWHFDDKLGQKYLLESVNGSNVNSYSFFSKKDALSWLNSTDFPKVFKLRGGASGVNVIKVKNFSQGKRLVNKAFRNGFAHINRWTRFKDRVYLLKRDKTFSKLKSLVNGFVRLIIPTEVEKYSSKEKGYAFFQDFIPNNTYDTRLIVVGNRCFGTRRYCRPDDFRASGSGLYDNNPEIFDMECVKIAFDISKKLSVQSIAYDFLWNDKEPVICEISYIYCRDIIANCDGYWNDKLEWVKSEISAEKFIAEDFVNSLK